MADSLLSNLTAATTPLAGTELVYLDQGSTDVKATTQNIADLVTTISGNAGSATILATARAIGIDGSTGLTATGVNFNGSAAINMTLTGTLDVDNGGTGQTSYTDGQLLIGNTTGNTLTKATLTAGAGVSVTNGGGSITVGASSNAKISPIGATFDGGGSAVTNGSTAYIACPFAGTIAAYTILVDTGTCTLKTWKIAAGTAIPTVANSINTSGVAISSGTAVRSTTLSDFTTTTVTANDIFAFNITAISGATKIVFELEITRT